MKFWVIMDKNDASKLFLFYNYRVGGRLQNLSKSSILTLQKSKIFVSFDFGVQEMHSISYIFNFVTAKSSKIHRILHAQQIYIFECLQQQKSQIFECRTKLAKT